MALGARSPVLIGRTMAEHSSHVTANDLFWTPSLYDASHDRNTQTDMMAQHAVQDKTATQEVHKKSKQAKGDEVHGNE